MNCGDGAMCINYDVSCHIEQGKVLDVVVLEILV